MKLRTLFLFLFVLAFEIYAFQAFKIVFGASTLLSVIYFSITGILFLCLLLFAFGELKKRANLPRGVLTGTFFMLFIPKVFITILLLVEDVFRLLKSIGIGILQLAGNDSMQLAAERSTTWSIIALCVAGFLSLSFIYGALFNVYNYKVRKVKVKLLKLPKAFDGLKVVQISDIHSGSLTDKDGVQKAINKINDLQPDVIFFTGDLVNNIATEALGFVDSFKQLKSTYGVYSILGNHDYGDYAAWPNEETKKANLDLLKQIHADMGWRLLLNEHVHLEKDGAKIAVAGVENISARGRFHSYGKLENALFGIQDAMTVLLLSHDPSHWEAEVLHHPAKVDITFSGHTHGMQFGFELFNIKWSPVKYIYKQWAGLYSKNKQHLYVNRGFGVIGYPGRVGILPEITLFTLHQEED
jgi:uncharacterized protein